MMATIFINLLESWVREAVARHGDDWPSIMALVEEKLKDLGEDQRAELSEQLALVLLSNDTVNGPHPN